jgi:hypothetical protein
MAVLALPAFADTRFNVRRMARNDAPPGRGQCDIRLQVDDRVEVAVSGDDVFIRTLSGQDARDDGSECNAPMPGGDVPGFNFEVKERRGDINLVEGPSRRNGGRAIVQIHDGPGGFGRYIFRLSWTMAGGPDRRPDGDDRRREDDRRPPDPDRRPSDDRRPDADTARDLRIVNAFWGAPGRGREVTRILQDRIRDGRLRMRASNEDIGFDPAQGIVKTLTVVYEIRGRRQEVKIPEGEYLELPR